MGNVRSFYLDIAQWAADNAPNTMGNFTFEVTLGYRRLEKPCR
jgi:hypothetical protein